MAQDVPDEAGNGRGAAAPAAAERVLGGLDPEQRVAVTAPAGPVCILAGAGTGKTRAITYRVAYRVLAGEVHPQHVLAVTFTARAAAEMRSRLAHLGVPGVQARTFHAAALRQLRYFAPRLFEGRELPELVESKVRLVGLASARVGVRADRTAARDLAAEIEWAKSSMVEPGGYALAAVKAGREPPLEAATVAEVYAGYERAKRSAGVIDFEDLLRAAVWAIEEHTDVADQVHAQYRHFVVDEYQDVNPVQQRLLEAWLGGRDDVTVVGDASQMIYSFTGASSSYLLEFPRRFPGATVVRLVRDYRSTPQVVGLANAVIGEARGELARLRLTLVGQRPSGPEPDVRFFPDEPAEAAAVAARCAELVAAGTAPRQIAVLFRTNAQSEAYEEALAEVGVPYVVRDAERFFDRPEIRRAMVALRAAIRTTPAEVPLRDAVVAALEAVGWRPDAPPAGGAAREQWAAVAALVGLADEFAGPVEAPGQPGGAGPANAPGADAGPANAPGAGVAGGGSSLGHESGLERFCAAMARRAALQHAPAVDGVTLSSLHSAKGLEWDVVFVVGLAEGTLPTTYARTPESLEEERRLLYVGITRARYLLWLSYPAARSPGGRQRRPCRFLPMLDSEGGRSAGPGRARSGSGRGERKGMVVVSCRVCGTTLVSGVDRKLGRCATCPSDLDEELYERLRQWRLRVAGAQKVPAYVVFTDATLTAIAERRPTRAEDLIAIAGIGPRKLSTYGDDVLALIGGATVDDLKPVSDSGSSQ